MKLIGVYLLLLLIGVALSVKDEENSVMNRAHDMQVEMGDFMKKLIDSGQIRKSRITWDATNEEHNLYEFTGEHAQKIPLKNVFDMLQSWNWYVQNQAKPFLPDPKPARYPQDYPPEFTNFFEEINLFKFNFGDGQAQTIGLQVSSLEERHGGNAIKILNSENTPLEYTTIFQAFENSGLGEAAIAGYMLEALNKPMNDQPVFPATLSADLRAKMLNLAVIIETAEGARPSDDFYQRMKDASIRVHGELSQQGFFEDWITEFSDKLTTHLYDVTDMSNEYETFRDYLFYFTSFDQTTKRIQDTKRKLRNEQNPQIRDTLNDELDKHIDTLKRTLHELSEILPKHTADFYSELSNAKRLSDNELRDFLANKGFNLDNYNLDRLKNAIDSFDQDNTRTTEIEDFLPSITEAQCKRLLDGGLKVRMQRFKTNLDGLVALRDNTGLGRDFKPNGRIPGAGYLARALLAEMVKGNVRSWREFDRIFRVSAKDGLRPARENRILFDVSARPEERLARPAFDEDRARFMQNHRQPFLDQQAAMQATRWQLPRLLRRIRGACTIQRKKRSAAECDLKEKILDDSVQWDGDNVRFKTVDDHGVVKTHEAEIPVDKMAATKYFREKTHTAREVTEKIGIGIGVYGTLVNGLTAIEQFINGNYGQGAFSAIQTIHSIGGLTKFNTKFQRLIVRKAWNKAAEKFGFEKITEALAEPIAREAGKAGKTLARFMEDIPFVGLAFDIYFIAEDIKALLDDDDKTPQFLKIAHLILDVETTVLTLVETFVPELEPFIEPIVIALTIIRMTIDDFYYDIKRELDKVKGANFGTQVLAFWKGFGEGIGDFLTLGLVTQLLDLKDETEFQSKLWNNMTNPGKYFNQTLARTGQVDFNGGVMSGYGGLLTVTLNEDGSFTMELPEVYVGTTPRSMKKTFRYPDHPANEIVLGIGQVQSPRYIHKDLKLWLFIPLGNYEQVSGFLSHDASRYGRYYGNSLDNSFYTIQRNLTDENLNEAIGHECDIDTLNPSDFNELLSKYQYNIFGHGGNDKFFLGPQASTVLGGDGKDLYYIPVTGGKTVINNFALDEKLDTLFMNVSYSEMYCHRHEHDLIIHYCDSHVVMVKHWFLHGENSEYFRHINIVTNDEVVIDVSDTDISSDGEYQVTCNPLVIDKSRSSYATVDLTVGKLVHVIRYIGTNSSDVIIGNDRDNQLIGGLGNDILRGGEGEDIYIHREGDGQDIIVNYAEDEKNDTIMVGINYNDISLVIAVGFFGEMKLTSSRNDDEIRMLFWPTSSAYQHALFISKDYVSFLVLGGDNPVKYPINIDFSHRDTGANLDLASDTAANGFQEVTTEMVNDIKLIIDSPYNDVIAGNIRNNVMMCSGPRDRLQGNSGSDTYVVKKTCEYLEIVNEDPYESVDLLLLNCSYVDITMRIEGSSNLLINWQQDRREHTVKLIDWFDSSKNQHLMVKTHDKWTFLPPETLENFKAYVEPYQIETSESCDGGVRTYDFNQYPYQELQRFMANASNCRFVVTGNSKNNYIDPGPSDSYGYQVLTGGNGSDTYVFGHNYGVDNAIHNYATDGEYDHLKLNIIYKDIHVEHIEDDIVLSSISVNNSINVSLHEYALGKEYQHIFIHSSDGIIFQVKIRDFKVSKEVSLIDYSASRFSQIISASTDDPSFAHVRGMFGSEVEENEIHGGEETMKIVGGNNNDRIFGGNIKIGEDISGLDGDDYIDGGGGDDNIAGGDGSDEIFGGDGNDDIYGGEGADKIDGGDGSDTLIFSGDGETDKGVLINLLFGVGVNGDAEGDTYISIENIKGSQFNDTLIGDGNNNDIRGNGGDDYIIPGGGFDVLQGGLDADIYDVTEAYGLKLINNYASDGVLDTVLFSDVEYEDMCYYYLGHDLHIVINHDTNDSPEAMERALLNQEYLEVQLLYWSGNETYRHLALLFSDEFVYPENTFTGSSRDFNATSTELQDETMEFLSTSSVTQTSIRLDFHFNSLSSSKRLPSDALIHYIHSDQADTSSVNSLTLSYNYNSGYGHATVNGLTAGTRQSFVVMMSICNAKAAISSMHVVTTLPNPPSNIHLLTIPGGLKVTWTPPSDNTDPNVFYYGYTIKYWRVSYPSQVYTVEYDDVFSYNSYALLGTQVYSFWTHRVSIASRINGTLSEFVTSNNYASGGVKCSNFRSLPAHMYISSIDLVRGNTRAYLACENNYGVSGDGYIDCNGNSAMTQQCVDVHCSAVHDTAMKAIPVHESVGVGETNQWTCYDNYELVGGGNTFSSTCQGAGGWDPPLQTCVEKPRCSNYPSIQNGYVQPAFAYRDEEITFSCQDNYSRDGPEKKTCIASGSSLVYSPSTTVQCISRSCPTLLPQPNGRYSLPSGTFVDRVYHSGEVVNLQCNDGYYINEDDQNSPDRQTLTCTIEGHWSVQQQECQPLIHFTNINQHMFDIRGDVQCRIPGWSGCSMSRLFPNLNSFACDVLGGHQYVSLSGTRLTCSLTVSFQHHPSLSNGALNTNAGRLTISYPRGSTEVVCPNNPSSSSMDSVCSTLGFSLQYTAKLIDVAGYHTSKEFTSISSPLTDRSQTCTKMISCRGTCDTLSYVSGLSSQCNKVLEGETCYLDCTPGSERMGSRERVCQSNGQWSGERTSCDADQWRSDTDTYIQRFRDQHNDDAARLVITELSNKYPDVTWVGMIYDDVSGFDKHTIYDDSSYVYYQFRYYGKNFAVGRYTSGRRTYSSNLDDKLEEISADAGSACKEYCPDPACWFPYYKIDSQRAAEKINNKMRASFSVRMVLVVQSTSARLYVRRVESSGSRTFSYSYISEGRAAEVEWDRRVAVRALRETCDYAAALVMAD